MSLASIAAGMDARIPTFDRRPGDLHPERGARAHAVGHRGAHGWEVQVFVAGLVATLDIAAARRLAGEIEGLCDVIEGRVW